MRNNNTSIRTRLFTLAGLSFGLMALLLLTTRLTDHKVNRACQDMDSAQQTIQKAREDIDSSSRLKDDINLVQQRAMDLRLLEKTFLQFHTPQSRVQFDQLAESLAADLKKRNQTQIENEFRDYRKAFSERAELQTKQDTLNANMGKPLQNSEERLANILGELDAKQATLQMEGGKLRDDELDMMNVARDCRIVFLKLQNLQQLFVSTGDQKYIEQYKRVASTDAQAGIRTLREFASALNNTNFIESSSVIGASLNEFLKSLEQSLAYTARQSELEKQLDAKGIAILKAANEQLAGADHVVLAQKATAQTANTKMKESRESVGSTKISADRIILLITAAGIVAFVIIFFAIVRSINRSLGETISDLNKAADHTASASSQILSSSNTLADGASRQASSLEQTSASLEEMSSMTKRSADNTLKATDLAKQTRHAAETGARDMQSMNTAMAAIKASSDDISKIIKTINEIAFQTNILALNAAVEAARAGEAGMGFAVVAEEVRSLAQRSAMAANETAAKIDSAINCTRQGVEISSTVGQRLQEIVTRICELDELVTEVSTSSREQNDGIGQINKAVSEMDKVTQSNAASAEESAAANELNSQSVALKDAINDLLRLVGGSAASIASVGDKSPASHAATANNPAKPRMFAKSNGTGSPKAPSPRHPAASTTAATNSESGFDDFRSF